MKALHEHPVRMGAQRVLLPSDRLAYRAWVQLGERQASVLIRADARQGEVAHRLRELALEVERLPC